MLGKPADQWQPYYNNYTSESKLMAGQASEKPIGGNPHF